MDIPGGNDRAAIGGSSQGIASPVDAGPYGQRILNALDDDLKTPDATAALRDLAAAVNGAPLNHDTATARQAVRDLGGLLGLSFRV